MTRTIRFEDHVDPESLLRAQALDAWRSDWSDLARDRSFFGIDMADDVWVFPDALFRRGVARSMREIDFGPVLPQGWGRSDPRSTALLRRIKRLVRLLAVSGMSSKRRTRGPSRSRVSRAMGALTLTSTAKDLISAVRALAEQGLLPSSRTDACPDGHALFAHLDERDFRIAWEGGGKHFRAAFTRLTDLRDRDLFDDWVAFDRPLSTASLATGQNATDVYEDSYFTDLIQAALEWSAISGDVCDMIRAFDAAVVDDLTAVQAAEIRREILQEYQGIGFSAQTVFAFPTVLSGAPLASLSEVGRPVDALVRFFGLAQAANAFLVTVATGMRPAELDDLPRACLSEGPVGPVLRGSAFKPVDEPGGMPRDWPLPTRAVDVLRRQISLADLVDPSGPWLWVSPPYKRGKDKDIPMSIRLKDLFKLLVGPDGVSFKDRGPVSVYRTRTSIARLLALSVQGGPHILYTVYGHRHIEETMGYYRARGDFEEELSDTIHQVSQALGEDLLAEYDQGALPKRTARFVEATLDAVETTSLPRNGPDATGFDTLTEAARILGSGVELVRPGVLCTARGSGRGACATRTGHREPSNCVSDCRYRFETALTLQDRKIRIETHLAALATLSKDDLFRYRFARDGLFEALGTFEGILDVYLDDPRVRQAMDDLDPDERENLPEPFQATLAAIMEAT